MFMKFNLDYFKYFLAKLIRITFGYEYYHNDFTVIFGFYSHSIREFVVDKKYLNNPNLDYVYDLGKKLNVNSNYYSKRPKRIEFGVHLVAEYINKLPGLSQLPIEIGYSKIKNLVSCKGDPLHIDVWIPTYNIGIEIDGQQHHKKGHFKFENDLKSYNRQIENDNIKNKYFKNPENHSYLIRIPTADEVHNDLASNQEYKLKTSINIIRALDLELIPLIKSIKITKKHFYGYRNDVIQ